MKKSTTVATMANGLLKVLQRYTKGIRLVAVLTMLFTVGVGSMLGAEATWDFTKDKLTNTNKGEISMSYAKNNGTNDVAITNNTLRLYRQSQSPYNGCSVTFTASNGYKINSIKVVFDQGRTSARGKIDNGSYEDVFSAGNSKTVTISSLNAQSYSIQNQATSSTTVSISSINITYSSNTSTPTDPYTVTWNVNGEVYETTQVTEGSKPTFPETPSSCDATSTTFYGWATTTWDGKINDVSAKTIYTSANDMLAVNGAVTYYAVFAKTSEDSSGDYKLVTSLSNLKSGVAYLGSRISYSGVRYYYMSSTAISSNLLSISNATVSSNILQTPNSEGKINLVSTGTANQYYIKNAEGKYLYSNAAGSLSWSTTACSWTFSNMNSTTGLAELTSSANSNIKLRAYGTSTTQGKLKTYSGTTNNGICVFLAEATTTYSDYITTCTTKTANSLLPKYRLKAPSCGEW